MVAYELSLIVKNMSKAKVVSAVKRTADHIISQKGFIEKIEFLGSRQLAYRMSTHGQYHSKGSYFVIHYHAPYKAFEEVKDFVKLDLDIVRPMIFEKEIPKQFLCTLHEETKPPAYRAEVFKMMKEADERLPLSVKMRKEKEKELKNYIF